MRNHLSRLRGRFAILSAFSVPVLPILFAIAAAPSATAKPPLTVTGYRAQASAICAQERRATMSRLMGAKTLAHYLAGEVPVLRLNVRELALWKQIGAKGCASP